MKKLFFLSHLGMGDQIICNGLLREKIKDFTLAVVPTKHHNVNNVRAMYRDLKNINVLPVSDDRDAILAAHTYKNFGFEMCMLGCFGKSLSVNNETFDEDFFDQAGVDYSKRWEMFKYISSDVSEEELYQAVLQKYGPDYIFLHDDKSRSLDIDRKKIISNYSAFTPNHNLGEQAEYNLFDYKKIIQNAKQIHCMDSSFALFIDHIETGDIPCYIHRYLRKENENPKYTKKWTIIN